MALLPLKVSTPRKGQPQQGGLLQPGFGAPSVWLPSAGLGDLASVSPLTQTAYGAAGIGTNGQTIVHTGTSGNAGFTLSPKSGATYECWLLVFGSTPGNGNSPSYAVAGNTTNGVYINASYQAVLRMASTTRCTTSGAIRAGDVLFVVGKQADYRLYLRGEKVTAGLNYGNLTVGQLLTAASDSLALAARWTNELPADGQIAALLANPWQLIAPPMPIWLGASAGGVSGSLSWTEDTDTASLSGSYTPATVSGTVAWTEANDTASVSGSFIPLCSGSVSWTETNDTASLTGSITASGSLAWTEENDTASLSGLFNNGVVGSVAWTEANDTASVSGSFVPLYSGAVSWAEDNDTCSVVGGFTVSGVVGWTEGNDTAAIAGTVFSSVSGSIGWAENDDVVSLAGGDPNYKGGGAADYSEKRKRKYVVRVGDKLLAFSKPEEAQQFILAQEEPKKNIPAKKKGKQAQKPPVVAKPEESISLPEISRMAAQMQADREYQELLQKRHYEALIGLYEALQEQDDEEVLLLAA